MALLKIAEVYPHYKENIFGGTDIKGFDVYAGETNDKIGTVHDILVDETGRFRYLVIDTGFWIFGKKVLLPIGRCRTDYDHHNVYALGLTSKEQAERLPEYHEGMAVDYEYEERVRSGYRTTTPKREYTRESYQYEHEPELYQTHEEAHGPLKLYEERLVANKQRQKAGEVAIGKHVETETAQASVPVERERVIVERRTPSDAGRTVKPGDADFREGEVARMEVFEEEADISKQAVVREEVNVTKERERDTVNAKETLRHEELDVDIEGNPKIKDKR
ncbi:MAG: DUF2382 domain-containing protein [Chroococcales cyanobacterium]